MKKIYVMWALCAYMFSACSGNASHSEHAHDHEHEHEHEHEEAKAETDEHAGEIVFKKERAEAVGLKTRIVEPCDFTEVIKTSGQMLPAQGDEATVVATVSGVVSLSELLLIEGMPVGKGETILELSTKNLSDGDVAIKTKSAYEAAKLEYERQSVLVKENIVSAKDFEQARMVYESARVAYEAIDGKQQGKGIAVTSPIKGYLKNIVVREGDYVTVGQPLAGVSKNNRLMLRADIPEKYFGKLSTIHSANFKTSYDDTVYKLSDLNGRKLSFGKSSESDSFYVPVLFDFENKGSVISGSYVEVYLLTDPIENTLCVPISSLIEEQGIYSVYVRLDEEGFRKQEVRLGADNGKEVQVLSGLKPGDEVVTEAAYQIKLASSSNAIPAHSHSH